MSCVLHGLSFTRAFHFHIVIPFAFKSLLMIVILANLLSENRICNKFVILDLIRNLVITTTYRIQAFQSVRESILNGKNTSFPHSRENGNPDYL